MLNRWCSKPAKEVEALKVEAKPSTDAESRDEHFELNELRLPGFGRLQLDIL